MWSVFFGNYENKYSNDDLQNVIARVGSQYGPDEIIFGEDETGQVIDVRCVHTQDLLAVIVNESRI